MGHLRNCNIAETQTKMLPQNIYTLIQRESTDKNTPQRTLHLCSSLQKNKKKERKKKLSPSLLFIQTAANLHLCMRLNKTLLSDFSPTGAQTNKLTFAQYRSIVLASVGILSK